MQLSVAASTRNILDKTEVNLKKDLLFTENTLENLNIKNKTQMTFTHMCRENIYIFFFIQNEIKQKNLSF